MKTEVLSFVLLRRRSDKELSQDASFLKRLWSKVTERRAKYKTRSTLYGELGYPNEFCDFVGTELNKILVDSRLEFENLKEFTSEYVPELTGKLELYEGEKPIFDMYDTENEIQRALERKVVLKSGGYLIIDQTEAMTTIDINTGAFVGRRNLEETIFNTNIEATQAITKQLRLRTWEVLLSLILLL